MKIIKTWIFISYCSLYFVKKWNKRAFYSTRYYLAIGTCLLIAVSYIAILLYLRIDYQTIWQCCHMVYLELSRTLNEIFMGDLHGRPQILATTSNYLEFWMEFHVRPPTSRHPTI